MTHPTNKAERLKLLKAKSLQHRRINGQKRKIQVTLKKEESEHDLRDYLDT